MESDSRKRDGLPNWRIMYDAAVLELDSSKALARIAQAEEAIMLEALKDSSNDEMLASALTVLEYLRTINDHRSQDRA